ncbi:sugar kinase [Oceanobacillus sp. J11TS1]|uniref:sugar kinase n=1 Tax=Oceanobacillus sp. J11TS1 TaxID=2807191 RepID=UPI001B06E59D|nr:sugar kinase [Oceanobacillus sp. J11TS1]GIO24873.1 2-dehydro-3-deoxygluconokinase [Oceanobacillus sp. J11TS1]
MDVLSIGETMVLFSPKTSGQLRYANDFSAKIAGAETNTLIGLAKLGHQTSWISKVGNDELGAKIVSAVRGEGVETTYVKKDKNASTGIFLKEKTNAQTTSIFYYRKDSAASKMTPEDIEKVDVSDTKYLYVTGITPALSKSCKEAIFALIHKAKQERVTIVFDPNIRKKLLDIDSGVELIKKIIGLSDIVLPGKAEGEFLFTTTDSTEIAKHCRHLGAGTVVVKLGEKGAYFENSEENGMVDAYAVPYVVDPVGAGDGFAAGLLSGLLDELTWKEAVKRACAVGALVTQVDGDIEGLPTRNQLQAFMESKVYDDVNR